MKNLPISRVLAAARASVVAWPGSVKYLPSSALLLSTMHNCCDRNDMDAFWLVTTLSVLLDTRFTLDTADLGTQKSRAGGLGPSSRHTVEVVSSERAVKRPCSVDYG